MMENSYEKFFNVIKLEFAYDMKTSKNTKKLSKNFEEKKIEVEYLKAWLLKKNSEITLLNSKNLLINENQTYSEFFSVLTNLMLQKNKKLRNLLKNHKIIKLLLSRTSQFIEKIDYYLKPLFLKKTDEINQSFKENYSKDNFNKENINFNLTIDKIENFDMENIVNNEDFIGFHFEIGYKNNICFTQSEKPNNNLVIFKMNKLNLELNYKTGTSFVNLFQDFLKDSHIEKKCVASRNLDFFSNLNPQFLKQIAESKIENNIEPEIFYLNKLTDLIKFDKADQ